MATRARMDEWVLSRRPARNPQDPRRPHGFFLEGERSPSGNILTTATVLLTNKECPWRCVMCDLWKDTLEGPTPAGAIPEQISYALKALGDAPQQIKLYNSGSFFDASAIPPDDYAAIASILTGFKRVIVESHPALVGNRALKFQALLSCDLEVAMGLETVHPQALARLNKGVTLRSFSQAAGFLRKHNIDLRCFVLLNPPFVRSEEFRRWAVESIKFSFEQGATAVSVIPVRPGNGAIEALAETGDFAAASIRLLEETVEAGIRLGQGRVFADLWDLERLSRCPHCYPARRNRLEVMNLTQQALPPIECRECEKAVEVTR